MSTHERIVKSFGMTNMLIESDIDHIERRFGVQLRPKPTSPQGPSQSRLQFDESVRKEAAAMAAHYETFYCLEKSIRTLILDVFDSAKVDNWWTSPAVTTPQAVRQEVEKRIKREQESGVTPRSTEPLDYTTLGELSELIKANWALFGSVFNDQRAVETIMGRLNGLRGPIAHCTPLAADEVLRLDLTLGDWSRLLK